MEKWTETISLTMITVHKNLAAEFYKDQNSFEVTKYILEILLFRLLEDEWLMWVCDFNRDEEGYPDYTYIFELSTISLSNHQKNQIIIL